MTIDMVKLIPEIGLIKEAKLKNLTRKVWEEAMERGGWTAEDLEKMPFTLLIKKIEVNIIEHTRAVTLVALKIAEVLIQEYQERIAINTDYLLSGAILHDVGKLFEYKREKGVFVKSREGDLLRHPISGAAFAFKHGLPEDVLHIIAAHSKEGDGSRRTIEAIIVNHADFVNFDVFKES
jgi:putative nucleotidyltransferase with HDIG domain